MLLRGKNLVGYHHYAHDVVQTFVREAALHGIDIFRIFDALNDERNLQVALTAIRECGKHAHGALCYSLTC
jgi:pyruvate carboxylase subunit B